MTSTVELLQFNREPFPFPEFPSIRAAEEAGLTGGEQAARQSEPLSLFPLLKMAWKDRKKSPADPPNGPH